MARYDSIAKHYEAVMRPLERWFLDTLRDKTLKKLPAGAHTLEVGAGTGSNFKFYPVNSSGVASEVSGEMLKVAKDKPRPAEVHLLQNDAEELPFADRTFDAAFATLVFCSVEAPKQALTEMRRVVRPGGTIVLLEHVRPNSLLGVLFDVLNLFTAPLFCDHINRRTAETAREAGLEVLSVEKSQWGILNLITCRV
jgi:phosphatidylethanolamine/phosphatidyl-N-methylethanolamine N-methyltransferase